ncbi:MAG: hypothetical protein ABI675_29180 [Chitinophagaceae bacterium]
MLPKILLLITCSLYVNLSCESQPAGKLSINGFTHWLIGHDSATTQLIPSVGSNGLTTENNRIVAHAKFNVAKYGELSFPIKPSDAVEALPVDLSKSKFIKIEYKANHEVILQLRQTGVHGGVHNHIVLPASDVFVNHTIYFSSFKDGPTPLDLSNVAKFNFAFLGNNPAHDYAELVVRSFKINRYKPAAKK